MAERYNDIGMLHGWLDKIVVGRFDEAVVLCQYVHNGTPTISNVSLNYVK